MDAERWAQVKALFHAALEHDPHQRDAFLTEPCRGETDPQGLRSEIDRLLAAHAQAGHFIEVPPVESSIRPARVIGRYEVVRLPGAGGMGEVYLARDRELGRDVAVKLATGRILVAESVRGADLFSLVDQLASRIRDGVGLQDASDVRGVAAVSSPSPDAYRLFAQGTEAYQNVRIVDATRLLEEAVRVDPNFASAYLYLGFVDYFSGRYGDRQKHFAKASEHMERLSERQRLLLRSELARDAGNGVEAERLLDQLFAEFPDWHDGYASALELYAPITGLVHNPAKRLAILKRGVDAQPNSSIVRNSYGYALLEDGRFKEAPEQFETYAQQSPHEPNPFDSMGEAYLALGRPDDAIQYFTRALTMEPDFFQPHPSRELRIEI